MTPVETALARWRALEIMKSHLDRERPDASDDSLAVYMEDGLLLRWMARRGHPMLISHLRGSILTYLRDGGYVAYKQQQPAGPGTSVLLFWRITHDGIQLLEGTRTDPGVSLD